MSCISIDFCNLLQSDRLVPLTPALIIFSATSHRFLLRLKKILTNENESTIRWKTMDFLTL